MHISRKGDRPFLETPKRRLTSVLCRLSGRPFADWTDCFQSDPALRLL